MRGTAVDNSLFTFFAMASLTSKTAAKAGIQTMAAREAPKHPNPCYLAPSTTHRITERIREKVVKWINEVR